MPKYKGIKIIKPEDGKREITIEEYKSKNPKVVQPDMFQEIEVEEARYYYDIYIKR